MRSHPVSWSTPQLSIPKVAGSIETSCRSEAGGPRPFGLAGKRNSGPRQEATSVTEVPVRGGVVTHGEHMLAYGKHERPARRSPPADEAAGVRFLENGFGQISENTGGHGEPQWQRAASAHAGKASASNP